MAKNRKAAEEFIIKSVGEILGGNSNEEMYKNLFASMNDKEFDTFMDDLKHRRKRLCVVAPNFSDKKIISVERNLQLAKKFGVKFFQKVWMPSKGDVPRYLTPIPYLVMDLPLRKASQILDKKMSVPESSYTVDNLTGQPAGDSYASRVSFPELQVLAGYGLDNSITELYKYRGGDVRGYQAMNMSIDRTGAVSLETMANFASGVESTKTLKVYLTGMHLKSTL